MTITIGIDISKLKFDATFLDSDNTQTQRTFDNNQAGFEAFCRELPNPAETRVALEAPGVYGESVCQFLYDLGCTVYLLNPASTQFYSKSMLRRCKTDKSDGALIAQFLNHHACGFGQHEVKLHYTDQLAFLDQKILAIEQEMLTIVKIHSELRGRFVTLISIEGI
jgi:transposase